MTRPLTGRHVLIIAVTGFAIVIAANMAMLFAATGSFPGLVVGNSYVASQKWNAEAEAQNALGWKASIDYAGGTLSVGLTDREGKPITSPLIAEVGRPSSDRSDREYLLVEQGSVHAAPVAFEPGIWRIVVKTREGPAYHVETRLVIPEGS